MTYKKIPTKSKEILRNTCPRIWPIQNKKKWRYMINIIPKFPNNWGYPVLFIIRELFKLITRRNDFRKIECYINGIKVQRPTEVLGIYETFTVDSKNYFQYLDTKLKLLEIEKPINYKILYSKKYISPKIICFNFIGGESLFVDNLLYNKVPLNSLIELDQKKIKNIIPFEPERYVKFISAKQKKSIK